jgi:glutamine synthetase
MINSVSQGFVSHVDVYIVDTNGIPRGKRIPVDVENPMNSLQNLKLIGSLFALTVRGSNVDRIGLAMERGDPDLVIQPVSPIMKTVWLPDSNIASCLCTMYNDSELYWADPRNVLSQVLNKFQVDFPDYTIQLATETEFYLTSNDGQVQPPINPKTGKRCTAGQTNSTEELQDFEPFLKSVRETAKEQGWKVTSEMAEYGAGQFEINLPHCKNVLQAADEAIFLKRAVKGCAKLHNFNATFMSKPYKSQPGSGFHVHISLLDSKGRNVFSETESNDDYKPSQKLYDALAGLLHTAREASAVFAPQTNSYARLRPKASYAPTHVTWARDNRTVALRIVGNGDNTRIEHRLAGADANPYLVLASIIAGIAVGLKGQVSNDCVEWWAMEGVSAYLEASGDGWLVESKPENPPEIPRHLHEALYSFKHCTLLDEYLTRRWKRLFWMLKTQELDEFMDESESKELEWLVDVI